MKKTLLSLFALATAAVVSAQTTVYDLKFIGTGDVTDETTVSVTGGTFSGTLREGKTGLIVSQADYYAFKMQGGDETFVCTPTDGLQEGDIISITGFVSSGDAGKSAIVKLSYDDTDSYAFPDEYDAETNNGGFTDLKEGGYNSGSEPNTFTYKVPAAATKFLLKRNSAGTGGATSAFVISIVITRGAASGETPETPVEPDDSPINDIQIEAQVVAVEYFTLAGAKVDEPVKGINIVKTYYSDNTTTTTTLVK